MPAQPPVQRLRKMPVSITIVLILLAVFLTSAVGDVDLMKRWELLPTATTAGEWHRLLTYSLVHASIWRLVATVLLILLAGAVLEPRQSVLRTGLQVILGVAGRGCMFLLMNWTATTVLTGAEGAAYALVAASGLTAFRFRHSMEPWEKTLAAVVTMTAVLTLVTPGRPVMMAPGAVALVLGAMTARKSEDGADPRHPHAFHLFHGEP